MLKGTRHATLAGEQDAATQMAAIKLAICANFVTWQRQPCDGHGTAAAQGSGGGGGLAGRVGLAGMPRRIWDPVLQCYNSRGRKRLTESA